VSIRHDVLKVELVIPQRVAILTSNIYFSNGDEEHLIASKQETIVTVKDDVWEVFKRGTDQLVSDLMATIGLSAGGTREEEPLVDDDDETVTLDDDDPEL